MSRNIIFIALIVSLTAILVVCSKNGNALQPAELQKFIDINMQKAESLALQQVKGEISTSKLELENGLLVYRFLIQRPNGKKQTVYINAMNGLIVSEKKPSTDKNDKIETPKNTGLHKQLGQIKEIFMKENSHPIVGTVPVTKDTDLVSLAKVGDIEAQDAAVSLVEGNVENVKLENEDGYLVYIVQVRYKGNPYYVLVDAGNDKVLEIDDKN